MRAWILAPALATAIAVGAAPAGAIVPPAAPAAHEPMRELPRDWLDDADLNSVPADTAKDRADGDRTVGAAGDDRLAGGDRGATRADLGTDCKESSGTTGAILGAVAGGLLGNVIDGGHQRAVGTLLGAGGGALLGREVEKRRAAAKCR